MRKSSALFPLALLCSGCFETSSGPVPFDTGRDAFDFPAGQTRLLLRTFTTEWKNGGEVRRNHILGWLRVDKDTSFEGYPAKIVEGRYWEPYSDTLIRYRSRELYVDEGSQVSVYLFRQEEATPFLSTLLKTGSADTLTFSDRIIALRYPLEPDRSWPIRLPSDPFGSYPLDKEFAGMETLDFKGRKYACGVMILHSFAGIEVKSWIAKIGLLKGEIDFGEEAAIDEENNVVDSIHSSESYALLDLDIDSTAVHPYLKRYENGRRAGGILED